MAWGYGLLRQGFGEYAARFRIFVVGCSTGDLTLENVNVRNGGGEGVDGGAIDVSNEAAALHVPP